MKAQIDRLMEQIEQQKAHYPTDMIAENLYNMIQSMNELREKQNEILDENDGMTIISVEDVSHGDLVVEPEVELEPEVEPEPAPKTAPKTNGKKPKGGKQNV